MGRKRTHHDAARTKIVSARLTQETYDLISVHAEKLGLTRAGYVEHLIEDRPLRIIRPVSDELPVTFLNELKRIGNNLNQIAHARNAGQDVDPRHFQTVVTEIIATICSNEVLRRRYEQAEDEVRRKGGNGIEEAVRLRKTALASRAAASDARGAKPEAQPKPEPAPSDQKDAAGPARREPPDVAPSTDAAPAEQRTVRELRLSEDDIKHRLWPPGEKDMSQSRPPPHLRKARAADPKVNRHGPKASSPWFKLPWRL